MKTLSLLLLASAAYAAVVTIQPDGVFLLYFGGNVAACWNQQDRALGWNWSFSRREPHGSGGRHTLGINFHDAL